jgi:hypothetical protein
MQELHDLISMHHGRLLHCNPYKFTGDGWIVLVDASCGPSLRTVLVGLVTQYKQLVERLVLTGVGSRPKLVGLQFGIEKGPVANSYRPRTAAHRPSDIGQDQPYTEGGKVPDRWR